MSHTQFNHDNRLELAVLLNAGKTQKECAELLGMHRINVCLEINRNKDPDGSIAGFWLGLWHGLICPITLIISLFSDNVHFYEVYNSGGWYNFGFLLGVGSSFGGTRLIVVSKSR